MNARDIMTSEVRSIRPDASLRELAQTLLEHRLGGLPVVTEQGRLVGFVSETDLLRRPELETQPQRSSWLNIFTTAGHLADEYVRTSGRRVDEVMTSNVISVSPDLPVSKVVSIMERHGVRRLPIVVEGRLVGIVTRRDIVRALARELCKAEQSLDDRGLVKSIRKQITDASWGPLPYVSIAANNGEITLSGVVTDASLGKAAVVVAENTPGVTKVIDEIRHVESLDFGY